MIQSLSPLIYSICDSKYVELANVWLKLLRRHYTGDVLILTAPGTTGLYDPENKLHEHVLPDFDYKFTAKYSIRAWPAHTQYDTFLYMDLDVICVKPIYDIFDVIASTPDKLHGVLEIENLAVGCKWHRLTLEDNNNHTPIIEGTFGVNAGTFGFTASYIPEFDNYLTYSGAQTNAYCDQPIFNMYFAAGGKILPSLSEFVFLNICTVNTKPKSEYPLIHYLGSYGDAGYKLNHINAHHQ